MTWTVTRVLGDRNAGLYLAGVVVSGFGTSALWLTAGIWVKDLTGSNGLAALSTFALWAPTLVGPLLGTLADRVRRRPLLVWTNLGLAPLVLTLVTVDSVSGARLVLVVLLLYGAASVVHDAAESALLATAVDAALLGDLGGLRMTANEGMKLLAPLAGAGLYTAFGGAWVAVLDAVTFAVAAALLALLRVREPRPVRPTATWRARTAEGARQLWSHPRLRPLVLAAGATMLCAGVNGALVFAVVEALGHSPTYTGLLYVAQGTGSVVTGLAAGPLLRRLGEHRFAAYGIALTATAVALRAIPSDPVALVCGAAIGAGLPCALIAALTSVQRETPGPLLGRTTATAHTLMYAPNAIGLAAGAALVGLADLQAVLAGLGLACLLPAGYLLRGREASAPVPSHD
ncbi:MFS transporter [Streptomyces phyllanthi]|uniref:MFS transporter n=1 Tax=Streptomyces phyllanthi TaxID=1803180 RepID=A0A5N8WIG4_9ACTN|nr:MFS transporter [Streptomyces phyllanthi]MPY46304.1 MFS transporter [Streptomyces phyllanthi]